MHVAEIAIKRWQLTLVLFALLAALGYSAFTSTPRAVDPHFNIPVVTVVAAQPGADAAEIEQTITKPIEEILQSLDDVKEVRSNSSDGNAVITTEFDWSGDPEEYFNDAVREVTAIRSQLPESLAALDFTKATTTNPAIVQVALVSETASWYRMEKYARDLKDAFARLPNARKTEIYGLPQPEVTVAIDAGRLAELRLPVTAVADAVRQGGADIPGGSVTSGSRRFNVETGGAFRTLDSVKNLPLRSSNGSILRIGDVADVQWGSEEERVKLSHNGRRAVFVTANQKEGADATTLRNQLVEALEREKKTLPQDIEAIVQFDQSKDIQFRLRELARDFSIAVFLVIFTLLPLGLRASLIVMISIPLSLASGLLANSFMGWNLSQLVVAGFILSLGLLVDDSIVVVENISRHLRMGKTRDKAAIDGTKEITKAVLGSTGVLVFAFIPLLFLPEGAGQFTKSFIGTIIFTVLASMIVSLTIVSFLASRILQRDADPEGNALLKWMKGRKPDRIEEKGGDVIVHIGDTYFITNPQTIKLAESANVRSHARKMVASLEKEGIESISARQPGGEELVLEKSDIPSFDVPENEEEEIEDETRKMTLQIISLSFKEDNKWRLTDGAEPFTADIEDVDFLNKIANDEISFGKNDYLICEVRERQSMTSKGLKKERTVMKVIEHKPAARQLRLM